MLNLHDHFKDQCTRERYNATLLVNPVDSHAVLERRWKEMQVEEQKHKMNLNCNVPRRTRPFKAKLKTKSAIWIVIINFPAEYLVR